MTTLSSCIDLNQSIFLMRLHMNFSWNIYVHVSFSWHISMDVDVSMGFSGCITWDFNVCMTFSVAFSCNMRSSSSRVRSILRKVLWLLVWNANIDWSLNISGVSIQSVDWNTQLFSHFDGFLVNKIKLDLVIFLSLNRRSKLKLKPLNFKFLLMIFSLLHLDDPLTLVDLID